MGGGTPSKSNARFWDGEIPWVSPKDMKSDHIFDAQDHISAAALEGSATRLIPSGALLMVVRGMILAHSFPTAITRAAVAINQDMKALVPFRADLGPYLLTLTKGIKSRVLELVERSTHGTCKLPTGALLNLPIALPPLAEQRRIVARVDELMGLLDRLEAAREARDRTRLAARDAALAALMQATTPDEVELAWTRIAGRLDDLVRDPSDISALRRVVLGLAVRGHLVGRVQDAEDAELTLRRLGVSARAIERGAYDVPAGWTWCSLESLCTHVIDCLHSTPSYSTDGYPAIRTADVVPGRVLLAGARKVSVDCYRERVARLEPLPNDILYSREGERLGIAALVPPDTKLCLGQRMAHLRVSPAIDPAYLMWFLNAPAGYSQATEGTGGSTSPHVNMAKIRRFAIAVPPLPEQHRIVAKVDELMALLDRLEARLTAARETQAAFAAAAVHHLDA
ncbi:MAG: restriction endonuclease subunit S [Deltaproteobacteria bacterium]|nr:restriction endonuclease subunit S [Deltaproteobacteria bacterium]